MSNSNSISLRAQIEHMLSSAVTITEMAIDLKEKSTAGERNVCYLRSLAVRASRAITVMQNCSKSFLSLALRLLNDVIHCIERAPGGDSFVFNQMRLHAEQLIAVLEREVEYAEAQGAPSSVQLSDRIHRLEERQKLQDLGQPHSSVSTRSFKSDIDERYPESCSRDSLLDLNTILCLPTVPEDAFSFCKPPARTSSLSSLRGLRKVKLSLHRARSDDEDESENEDTFLSMDDHSNHEKEKATIFQCKNNATLGNIKEEN